MATVAVMRKRGRKPTLFWKRTKMKRLSLRLK